MISRRQLLQHGCVVGAYAAAQFPALRAFAQQLPLRRSVNELLPNDPQMEALREGVRKLKEDKPASDKLNWINLASIHGTSAGFNRCPHGNWYFRPWHRAYLLMFERIIREVTNFQDFAMPYWDWTRNPQMPAAFMQPAPNPLFEQQRDITPTDTLPAENVGQPVLDTILGEAPFETFGTSRPRGQDSLDASWIKHRTGSQGTLERNPHNNVHGLVGGLMNSARSARDPIFVMHHCNIDRIWALWRSAGNADSTDALWLDMPFQDHFVNPDGSPYSPTVHELLDYEALGYSYGLPPPPVPAPLIRAFGEKVNEVMADPKAARIPGIQTFQTTNEETATALEPLEIPIEVKPGLVAATAQRPSLPGAGTELLNFDLARIRAVSKPRALAFIRDIQLANDKTSQFRVFVNCDYLSQDTPIADRHYVGTFGFFAEHEGEGHARPSVVLDLTAALERLYGDTTEVSEKLRIQVLPVPRGRATVAETGTATPAGLELAFVSA
jgi:tyrosinase